MNNICSPIVHKLDIEPCAEPINQQKKLLVQEVESEEARAHLPAGVVGVLTASIAEHGLAKAVTMAVKELDIDIVFEQVPKKLPPPVPMGDYVTKLNPYNGPGKEKIKSSKGKTNYGSNYTPPKKKRKQK